MRSVLISFRTSRTSTTRQRGAAYVRTAGGARGSAFALAMGLAVVPAGAEDAVDGAAPNGASIASQLPAGGDPGGARKRLGEQGISYGLNYIGEAQGNVAGGIERRSTYIGRLEAFVDLDAEKIAGWKGFTVHAAAHQLHGDGLSASAVGNLMTLSFIEAHATTRLFELWGEQRLFDDKVSVRFGQMAADSEFFTSGYAAQFINATFGWPAIFAVNQPSGGPAFPLSAPGVRVQASAAPGVTVLAGVFDGDPAGPCAASSDPQECNRYGTNFRVSDPPLVMGEVQYRYGQEKGAGLAGTIKLGGWHNFGHFDDRRFDGEGVLLADTATTSGIALRRRGATGLYGIVDQQIWRPASGEPDKGIGVFTRVSATPETDRADIGFYVDGGIVFAGLVPGRPDDIVSFGAAYARLSRGARDADRDAVALGAAMPVRDHEALLEANYQMQIVSGWTLDADLQYIVHPGGNVANPAREDGAAIGNATVLTLHTAIKY